MRTLRGLALTAVLAAAVATANQFYYTVTATYQDAPENLWEIAARFLSDAGRAGEILDLNSGRVQPDGGRVTDPNRLRAGWHLVLPWDAVGADLHYGPVPVTTSKSSACERGAQAPAAAAWGQTLLTPNQTWPEANGSGIKVAVIGSGVDGSAPELANRVSAGADIAAGTGRGDTDCKGTGTALAGIVAGDDGHDGKSFGVAPKARIVPIRVGATKPSPRIAATALDVAIAAGVQVVLIGVDVDVTDPAVRAAVSNAITRDVVVVLPATSAIDSADGLLRVGAVANDRQPVKNYPGNSVDLLAPGVDVATIGRSGTGAEYAAAFVAGAVALVRSVHPGLRAAEVTRQLRATAAAGLVSPVAAVKTPLPDGVGVNVAPQTPSSGLGTLSRWLLWVGVGLVALLLLMLVLQRPARTLAKAVAHRGSRRRAQAARARMTDDNDDPFWEPPAGGGRGQDEEDTVVVGLSIIGR
jgi:membrane-anchored mycosin MYCP